MKFKINPTYSAGLSLLEVSIALTLASMVTLGLVGIINNNYNKLRLKTEAELLLNTEVVLQQYLEEKPQNFDGIKYTRIQISDLEEYGLLGGVEKNNFYRNLWIDIKPVYSAGKSYYSGINYLISFNPTYVNTSLNKISAEERGLLIDLLGARGGLYNKKIKKVSGLLNGWQVELTDYRKTTELGSEEEIYKNIYLHGYLDLSKNVSEILSASCFNPATGLECSKEEVNYSCNVQTEGDEIIFKWSGHHVDSIELIYNQMTGESIKADYHSLMYGLRLSEFCKSGSTTELSEFTPVIIPYNKIGQKGIPFTFEKPIKIKRISGNSSNV